MTIRNLTCIELEARLGEYLEGTLGDAAAADVELHLSGCAACAALVREFEGIVREAATLPPLAPARDLWPAIEARLATRLDAAASDGEGRRTAPGVIDLATHAAARREARTTHAWRRVRLGALAAGLVGITAVTTWVASRRLPVQSAASTPGNATAPAPASQEPAPTSATTTVPGGEVTQSPQVAATGRTTDGSALSPASNASRPAVTATLNQEITALRGVLANRREQLDPRTVAILESSLSTIDSAIAEARLALRADPASRFLSSQLDKALEKKLGLLRTAALLPART